MIDLTWQVIFLLEELFSYVGSHLMGCKKKFIFQEKHENNLLNANKNFCLNDKEEKVDIQI